MADATIELRGDVMLSAARQLASKFDLRPQLGLTANAFRMCKDSFRPECGSQRLPRGSSVDRIMAWLLPLVRDEVAKWILRGTVLLGLLALGSWMYQSHPTVPRSTWAVSAALLLGASAVLAREVYRQTSYRACTYPRVRFPYEIISKTISYRIDHDEVLHFSRTVRIRSRVDGLEAYQDKYLWTGGAAGLPSAGGGCVKTSQLVKAGIWTFFSTQLDRTLNRGQEHEFTVEWPPLENWRNSSPFVSSSTDEPTRALTFEVDLGDLKVEGPLIAEQLRSIESPSAFSWSDLPLKNGRIEWKISRPRLYRHYRLRWEWPGQGAAQAMPVQPDSRQTGALRDHS